MTEYLVSSGIKRVGKVELTVEEAKNRCIVHFSYDNKCYMDSGNCDLKEDGHCHRGTPKIIVRPEDKVIPIK
jgi:hypothetical protein